MATLPLFDQSLSGAVNNSSGEIIARERQKSLMLRAWILSGLFFMALPGTLLGFSNLMAISANHGLGALPAAWMEGHGHAQMFGWIGSFILGIGFYSQPALGRSVLRVPLSCFLLWTSGVGMRWFANIYGWHWRTLIPVSAGFELVAVILFLCAASHHKLPASDQGNKTKAPMELWMVSVLIGTAALAFAVIFNFVECVRLSMQDGLRSFPHALDQRYLVLLGWGFVVPVVWGFSARWLPAFLAIPKPNIYNGRDKFFFMVDDEWRNIRTIGQGLATVPTTAQAGGNFEGFTTAAGAPVTLYDPSTGDANGLGRTAFPNNTIPSGRIDPSSSALLKYFATSDQPAIMNGKVVTNYSYSTSSPQDRQSLTVRGDYYLSQSSQWAFRYSSGKENLLSTGLRGAGSKTVTNYYQYMGSNTWTLTPHIINEARFGYTHFFNSTGLLSAFTTDVVTGLKIPGLNPGAPSTWGIPSISLSSGPVGTTKSIWSGFGDSTDGPYAVTDPTTQIVDNVTWIRGKHTWRSGFEFNRQTFNQLGNQFSRGQFSSQPLATALESGTPGSVTLSQGDALADFLLGQLYQATVAVAVANANYVRNVQAYYIDDTYKLLPNLTISAGLRYELTPPWNDTFGNNFTVAIPVMPTEGATSTTIPTGQWPFYVRQGKCSGADVYKGLAIRWTDTTGPAPVCSNGLLPNGPLMHTQYLNFAPRLGIAYSPNVKLVIRTGYGLFYSQDVGNAYFDMARNIAGRVTFTNVASTAPYGNSNLNWANAAPGGSGAISNLPPSTAFVDAASHKTTYSEQFLLNIQQQIGLNWSFEAGYQGALSRHLYGFKNANVATPYGYVGTGVATSVKSRTPFSNIGAIQYVHDEGTGNYNAFSAKATRRFSNGLNVIASYTFGKSLDDTSGIRSQGNDDLFAQDNRCIRCDYGRSAFDVHHRIVGSALYEVPFGPGKLVPVNNKVLNAVIGGWQIGGIFTHQTGAVASPLLGADNAGIANAGGNFDRPNPTGQSPYLSGSARSLNTWINKAAYVSAAPGFFGTVGRGSFTGPGQTNLDASLHKAFAMPYNERHQLSIRFEAFNALNHPNWGTPNMTLSSSTFGRITSTASMRQLQLAAKYQF